MRFGRYQLTQRLGAGGMAEVFRASEEGPRGFSRDVALKRILPQFAHNPEFADMLATEARVSALLQHPVIVQILEFGEIEGIYYLALELVEGCDLRRLRFACNKRGVPMPPGLACYLMAEVASALAYAHARCDSDGRPLEIVHRDVSPSNIMVATSGAVKLLDFGIAKASSFVRDEQTRTGMLKGKLSYMSPEQANGLALDRRSDIFSLGIVFHECLVGARLFKADSDSQTLDLVRAAQVRRPSDVVSGIDPAIDEIVARMLAPTPDARYADCGDVVTALAPLTQRLGGSASALRRFVQDLGPEVRTNPVPLSDSGEAMNDAPAMAPTVEMAVEGEVQSKTNRHLSGWWQRLWPALGVLALGGAVLAVVRGNGTTRQPPAAASAPAAHVEGVPVSRVAAIDMAAPPRAASTTPPPSPQVRLHLDGTAGAEATIDGQMVGTVPLDVVLPRAAGTRLLNVKLAGHRAYSHQIAADLDVSLRIDLASTRPHHEPLVKNPFGQ
jgi:serine/threonine-protein kinase